VGQLRHEAVEKEAELKEKERFQENELSNNREVESKIALTERMYAKLKQEHHEAEKLRDSFGSEVSISTVTFISLLSAKTSTAALSD